MKPHRIIYIIVLVFTFSCSDGDKAIETVVAETERGTVLRNINRVSKDFIHTNFDSTFELEIEEQDIEGGNLLDFVRLHIEFRDHTIDGNNNSTQEVFLKDIPSSAFVIGPNTFPRTTILITYQEVIDALSIDTQFVEPGDQFGLRLETHLTDGRIFSTLDTSASVLTDACFFKSPFRYEINVIEVIPDELFTGTYSYEIVSEINNPSFGIQDEGIVSIIAGSLPNVRTTSIIGEGLEFTIADKNVYPKIYQSVNLFCIESGPHILSGPNDTSFGLIDLDDDTVFFLDMNIGFEGWDGTLDNGDDAIGVSTLYTFKFTKQ